MAAWDNTPTAVHVSTIPGAIFSAEDALLAAEKRLEALLDSLYVKEWQDFEVHAQTWGIDVYGVTPSDAAVDALLRVGFQTVTQHSHTSREFKQCACRLARRTT